MSHGLKFKSWKGENQLVTRVFFPPSPWTVKVTATSIHCPRQVTTPILYLPWPWSDNHHHTSHIAHLGIRSQGEDTKVQVASEQTPKHTLQTRITNGCTHLPCLAEGKKEYWKHGSEKKKTNSPLVGVLGSFLVAVRKRPNRSNSVRQGWLVLGHSASRQPVTERKPQRQVLQPPRGCFCGRKKRVMQLQNNGQRFIHHTAHGPYMGSPQGRGPPTIKMSLPKPINNPWLTVLRGQPDQTTL